MSEPPLYLLISPSSFSSSTHPQSQIPLSSTLSHPIIQYHYTDDSPLALLPQSPNEQVLLFDYDPATAPTARSISQNVAVLDVKVTEAPGAGAGTEGGDKKMYILETTINGPDE